MRTAGILGGFGPEATAKFQLEIVDIFRAKNIKTRPPLLIWQTPIPLEIEKDLVLKSQGIEKFLPFLIKGSRRLEKGCADFLVIPCNTLHILVNKLQKEIRIPVINLIEETAEELSVRGVNNIGIIASQAMISNHLHQRCLLKHGIRPIVPSESDQVLINQAINQILTKKNLSEAEKTLRKVARNLQAKGAKDILLTCTDLQLVFPEIKGIKVHDTLQILAEATVREILKGGDKHEL